MWIRCSDPLPYRFCHSQLYVLQKNRKKCSLSWSNRKVKYEKYQNAPQLEIVPLLAIVGSPLPPSNSFQWLSPLRLRLSRRDRANICGKNCLRNWPLHSSGFDLVRSSSLAGATRGGRCIVEGPIAQMFYICWPLRQLVMLKSNVSEHVLPSTNSAKNNNFNGICIIPVIYTN